MLNNLGLSKVDIPWHRPIHEGYRQCSSPADVDDGVLVVTWNLHGIRRYQLLPSKAEMSGEDHNGRGVPKNGLEVLEQGHLEVFFPRFKALENVRRNLSISD